MQHGIIGNCQYSALISPSGNVDWLCLPRFDSSFLFGRILDADKGGFFQVNMPNTETGKQSYVGNTNVLRTVFEKDGSAFELIDFAPRYFQYNRSFKPKSLIRIARPLRGKPRIQAKISCRLDYGKQEARVSEESNHLQFAGFDQPLRLTTNAPLTYLSSNQPFNLDRPIYFALTYGEPVEEDLAEICEVFLRKTLEYWETFVKHSYLPPRYQKEVIRSALVLKLHQFEDTGAVIASATTSIPEAAGTERNWDYRYCWIRDAVFSLSALQRLTHFEELEKFIYYLHNLVEEASSRNYFIQPVYSIDGNPNLTESILDHLSGYQGNRPVRVGNQAYEHLQYDVYGEILIAITPLFLDERFRSKKSSLPLDIVDKLVEQIEKYLTAEDAGLWEFRGIAQVHTFTLLLNWVGLYSAEQIYRSCEQDEKAKRCSEKKDRLAIFIRKKTYDKDLKTFTQAVGSKNLDASLLMLVNMGFLKADDVEAHQLVDAVIDQLSSKGGFLHRYVAPDDFGSTQNAFLICSFWLVEALAHLNRREEALQLLEKLIAVSNDLGLYSEDVDPETGTLWGNFPQTYSHVGLINAVFTLFPHKGSLYCENDHEVSYGQQTTRTDSK